MILRFSISNFGPINEEVTLSFEPTTDDTLSDYYIIEINKVRILKVGMIYGPNASGKSTILQALELLRDLIVTPIDQKTEKIDYKKHLLDKKSINNSTIFKLDFFVDEIKYAYSVEFNNDKIINEELNYYPNERIALVFSRKTEDQVSTIEIGSTINLNKKDELKLDVNIIKNNTVLGGYSKSNISNNIFDKVYKWFDNNLMPMINPSTRLFGWTTSSLEDGDIKKSQFIEMLKKADLNISDFEFIDEQIELDDEMLKRVEFFPIPDDAKDEIVKNKKISAKDVLFKHEFQGEDGKKRTMDLPMKWESSGTMRYYGLAGPVLSALNKSKTVFIDELETSLHPDLMKHLILTFLANSKSSQLIFTTHNVSLFAERDVLRNDAIWFTEKNKNGATNLYSASDFKSSDLRKSSSIFNAYKIGKLGAKPNTSGIFISNG